MQIRKIKNLVNTVIAFDGGTRYLVSFDGDWDKIRNDTGAWGQVVDLSSGLAMVPFLVHAILNRGEWQPFEEDDEKAQAILKLSDGYVPFTASGYGQAYRDALSKGHIAYARL